MRVLSRAVAAYLTLAREIGATPMLAPRTSGAVALYLAAKAPTPIRAVIGGHSLRARDADWDFGRGPVLEADAVPMLEFLLGRSDTAPRPAPPRPPELIRVTSPGAHSRRVAGFSGRDGCPGTGPHARREHHGDERDDDGHREVGRERAAGGDRTRHRAP